MRHVSMVLCFLVAVLFLTAGTQAAVLVDDGFTDGDRTNGADALDVNWWKIIKDDAGSLTDTTLTVQTDDGTPGIGGGNALAATHAAIAKTVLCRH